MEIAFVWAATSLLRAYSSVWKLRRARSAQTACGQRINEFPQPRHQVVQEPGVTGLLCAPKLMVSMAGATFLSLVSDSLASLRSAIWVTNSMAAVTLPSTLPYGV